MAEKKRDQYAESGVNIDAGNQFVKLIRPIVSNTFKSGVITDIGGFAGICSLPRDLKNPLLVAATDGVGTKLKVAFMMDKHDTVGIDLVAMSVNDILVQGAHPLFFMDYIGASRFDPQVFHDVIAGLCKACKENNCALLGGETAEMPGLYPLGEYDLVGTIVGMVEKKKVITGKSIKPGDVIIGLASGGLQTNGYSLARKVIFDQCGLTVNDLVPGTRYTVADAMLAVHRSFLKPVLAVQAQMPIQGMAHITGGGFVDNIPRVLPENCSAVINRTTWRPPTLFSFLQHEGRVEMDEMYRVFNMGIGYVMVMRPGDAAEALRILKLHRTNPVIIGGIEKGNRGVIYRDA